MQMFIIEFIIMGSTSNNMASVLLLIFLFVLGFAVVFGAFSKLLNYYRFCKIVNKIPGPPTHWLWGNLHQV